MRGRYLSILWKYGLAAKNKCHGGLQRKLKEESS